MADNNTNTTATTNLTDTLNVLWSRIKNYLTLNVEYAKLTAAEKLTRFLTVATVALSLLLLGTVLFFFLSLAIVEWIATALPIGWAYAIMGGVYLVIILIVVFFRKALIADPIARFISRLFFT
ncbi:MAG: phage holin family protein [Bacteroidales bacterium]|nr:phage holin family protein [Bacteroidales bacterium]